MEENETARRRTLIEDALDAVLPKASERPAVLGEAMRWAVEGGGKRIRPLSQEMKQDRCFMHWQQLQRQQL